MSDAGERLFNQFLTYHHANPDVYVLFKRFVAEAIAANKKRIGARLIAERVRWEVEIATRSNDSFKLSNNCTPFYVRLYLQERPDHRRLFELRASFADESFPLVREAT